VILPALPNQEFGQFHINPFKTWLVVRGHQRHLLAIYVLQKMTKGQRRHCAGRRMLGRRIFSTVTTVVIARRPRARKASASVLGRHPVLACGVMYLRLAALLALFTGNC